MNIELDLSICVINVAITPWPIAIALDYYINNAFAVALHLEVGLLFGISRTVYLRVWSLSIIWNCPDNEVRGAVY